MKPTKKVVVALTVAIVSVIGIGVSYAAVGAWNKQTTGTGSAKAQTLTFTAVATVSPSESTNLYPGGSGGSVTATITNPNPYQITVNLVGSASSITATGGCSTTGAAFTPNASISVPVAANGGTATATLGNLTIDTDTPNACQGQTYTVTAPVTASQSGS